jgi:hypothetical protein
LFLAQIVVELARVRDEDVATTAAARTAAATSFFRLP